MKGLYGMQNPVFIVGHERSGTSLAYRTIQKHSSFRPSRLSLQETGLFSHTFPGARLLGKPDEDLLNYMINNENIYNSLARSILLLSFFHKLLRKFYVVRAACNKNIYFWKAVCSHIIIRRFFLYSQKARCCKRIVEKTPRHIYQIDRIFSTYPNAKVIIMRRHPVYTFSSFVKRSKIQPDAKWLQIDPVTFTSTYRTAQSIANKSQNKYVNKVKIIPYENLVGNPEKEFKRICQFLAEQFEQAPIVEGEDSLKFWKFDPLLAQPITFKNQNWNRHISKSDAELIETRLRDTMDQIGYKSVV
jgi:hypothetical protein